MSYIPIDRREFLRLSATAGAASVALPAHASAAPVPWTGIEDRQLDSRDYSLARYAANRPALGFASAGAPDPARWQGEARAKLVELMGGFPERVPLRAEGLERVALNGYSREKIVFQTRDDLSAIGYFLVPEGRSGPLPTIVCITGHGRGADDIVGIQEDGTQRSEKVGYAYDFAIQAVEKGYAAFAIEPLGFGQRRDAPARARGAGQSSCQPAAGAALLLGESMVGWRVWDVMRTIDYLQERSEVDPARIATMGISGGGTVSLFSGAVDERVKATVVSCYFNTFRDSIVSLSHCMDNYVPGLLRQMEMYDVAGLVAPRALFVESGTEDRIFPLEGARTAYAQTVPIFQAFGASDRLGREIFEGGHEFHGVGAFQFLSSHL